jgi:hypothetical protein
MDGDHGILYEHIGSYLEAFLMERIWELGWLRKIEDKKYRLTDKGESGLEALGLKIKG